MIVIIPRKRKQVNNFDFVDNHRNGMFFVQYYITKNKPAIVKLLSYFYDNMDSNDNISIDNNNSQNNNIAMVL